MTYTHTFFISQIKRKWIPEVGKWWFVQYEEEEKGKEEEKKENSQIDQFKELG